MCGILGSYLLRPQVSSYEYFEAALGKLYYRGPNDKGVLRTMLGSSELTLGHTRLSIIDLTSGGHQPMTSLCGRYTIIFNGEIYNYKEIRDELIECGFVFQTESDTEVLLTAWKVWGLDCLSRLTGMFVFVVYDRFQGKLYCVRDPFGIKPFYYFYNSECFYFGSEIPAIHIMSGRKLTPNYQTGYDYLVSGIYDKSCSTFFDGVKQLLPGHVLQFKIGDMQSFSISRWFWPSIEDSSELSYDDAVEKLRSIFLDSIRLHLRSDVPVGAALSGGLDSSAIVCAMRYIDPMIPIHTFSFVDRNSPFSEEQWIDIVNSSVGATAHKILLTHDNLISDIDDLISSQGEPFGSTSIYAQYCVYRHAKRCGVTVTLDGQGADELFAGYSGYPAQRMLSMFSTGQPLNALKFLLAWRRWPGRYISAPIKQIISPLVPLNMRGLARKLNGRDPFPSWINENFVRATAIDSMLQQRESYSEVPRGRHLVHALRSALSGYGLNELLRHGDRNSMRWSVESRVPFLNPNIAHFVLSLPEEYLISNDGETKHILRAAMQGIVPEQILMRRDKIGFESPEKKWLLAARDSIENMIRSTGNVPLLEGKYCTELFTNFFQGVGHVNSRQVWRIFNYIRWHNAFF